MGGRRPPGTADPLGDSQVESLGGGDDARHLFLEGRCFPVGSGLNDGWLWLFGLGSLWRALLDVLASVIRLLGHLYPAGSKPRVGRPQITS